MKTPISVQDILLSISKDFEQELAQELDNQAYPQHHFSLRYKRKRQSIFRRRTKPYVPVLRDRLPFFIITGLVLTCSIGIIKILK